MFTECGMDVQIHGKWDLDERHHMEFLMESQSHGIKSKKEVIKNKSL